MPFIHLDVHSHYTFLKGTGSPHALCRRAKELGYHALALTDTNGFYGLPEFLEAARTYGIMPLVGTHVKAPDSQAVLLVKNKQGYSFLSSLLTRLHQQGKRFSLCEELCQGFPGCVVLSSDQRLLTTLGKRDDFFAELVSGDNGLSTFRLARSLGLPVVATGMVFLITPEEHDLHRILRAIDLNTTIDRIPPTEIVSPHAWLKIQADMEASFPYAPGALEKSGLIAALLLSDWKKEGGVFPRWEGEEESFATLRKRCLEGIKRRYNGRADTKVFRRLDSELTLIWEKGFADYFLVVADIVTKFPITCGRGSAAASLVSYVLGITHVDPVHHNLLFSRFLNEGRTDLPDIDVDFPWDERAHVLKYVEQRFGSTKVAAVANHIGFRSRGAVREVAKVFGIPDQEIKEVTRRLSSYTWVSEIKERIDKHPIFRGMSLPEPWPKILEVASLLEGYPRHLGTHCGGIVVTPEKVGTYVPVEISRQGVSLIQWEKDGTEAMGLVKIDLLGNRSLAVIRDSLRAIEENQGITLPYSDFNPIQDPATQTLIRSGQTMGVFYVESPAMRRLLVMTGKGDYDHLVVLSSIIRPAANKFINEYVRRVRGGTWEPLHPRLEHTLSETLGVMVYQEDVARVAVEAAGFTESDADVFRRILAKNPRKITGQRERFYQGALRNGIPEKVIDELWEMILSFSGYSFCKPHSASYALVSFKSAYLKVHFPAEFMAAVISNGGGFYSTRAYLSEAERMGLTVLTPDVNESRAEYTGKGKTIRVGLSQLKGLSRACLEDILEGRDKGAFQDLPDFMSRVKPHLQDSLVLLKSGALDSIGKDLGRVGMAWWVRTHQHAPGESFLRNTMSELPRGDLPPRVRLAQEIEALGFPVSCHPLALFQEAIDRIAPKPMPARELSHYVGKQVRVIGFPVTEKDVYTEKGEPMQFLSFEDLTAIFEAILFPPAYRRYCQQITFSRPFLLQGRVEEKFGALSLTVASLTPLAGKTEGIGHRGNGLLLSRSS